MWPVNDVHNTWRKCFASDCYNVLLKDKDDIRLICETTVSTTFTEKTKSSLYVYFCQYHACRWLGDARGQVDNRNSITLGVRPDSMFFFYLLLYRIPLTMVMCWVTDYPYNAWVFVSRWPYLSSHQGWRNSRHFTWDISKYIFWMKSDGSGREGVAVLLFGFAFEL